jgi:uncharacterized protein YcnI
MKHHTRTATRLGVASAVAGLGLAVAGPASAHVTITPSDTAAGAYTVLTVSVPHGCDGSATTKVAIRMPEEITEVTPTRSPFYDLRKVTTKLDEPITAEDGDEITERTSEVVYTARTPLPDGERDTFELSLQLPEDAEGKTLVFPAIQTCEKGETAWTEVPAGGQAEDDLEHPAPSVTVTAAGEDAHGAMAEHSTSTTAGTTAGESAAGEPAEDEGGTDGLAVAGLVAGLLGLVAGGLALARTRGRTGA